MNIFVILILLALQDIPELPAAKRADRRAARSKAIRHNRTVYNNRIGPGKWFDVVDEDGYYRLGPSWKPSIKTRKPQQGRWATDKLGGHRRFAKWSKDYYPSGVDAIGKSKWEEELKEYLNS